jgi:hypothetical protein
MKRIATLIRALFTLLILVSSGPALADDAAEKSIDLHFGVSNFRNSDGSGLMLDSSPIYGGGIEFRKDRLSLELSGDKIGTYVKQDITVFIFSVPPTIAKGGSDTLTGQLTIYPILLTGRFHFGGKDDPIDPYIGLGGGYYRLSFKKTGDTNPTLDLSVPDTGGYHANLGMNIKATPNMAMFVDARYVWARVKVLYLGDLAGFNTGDVTLNLTGLTVTWGLRISLDTSSVH